MRRRSVLRALEIRHEGMQFAADDGGPLFVRNLSTGRTSLCHAGNGKPYFCPDKQERTYMIQLVTASDPVVQMVRP